MKEVLNRLFGQEILTETEAFELLLQIGKGEVNNSQICSFMSAFMMRRPSVEEMMGFRRAMLQLCVPVEVDAANAVDIVGTGGDGKNTFNISTLSALVVAGAGYKVVKHGNYAASSVSGSSNVLELLGYRFTNDSSILQTQLQKANICFLHAPLFHPAMKHVAPLRKELGVRTFFNLLGPVINPAQPGYLLLGASHLSQVRLYQYLLEGIDRQYRIVHSLDGYDEISLTGSFKTVTNNSESIMQPAALGFGKVTPESIAGGSYISSAAAIFLDVLNGKGTPAQEDVVIVNSGFAIRLLQPQLSLSDCFAIAKESLQSGKASEVLKAITQ